MSKWTVYCHVFPNGKRYFGITRQTVEHRWKKGFGYDRAYMKKAVKKYNWNDIQHIILFENLEHEQALLLEQYYIAVYKSNNRALGYNITEGGDGVVGHKHTSETKQRLSEKVKTLWQNKEYRKHMSEVHKGKSPGNKGKPLPQWQKDLLSKINKGSKQSVETVAKRVKKLRGQKRTEEQKLRLSQAKKGIPFSPEHKHALAIAWRIRRSVALVKGGVN